jgi:AcrR family transcriptional regulator
MQHQRAINESEKQERRGAILASAMQLFMAASFDAVNMQAVADQAGIAKGTTYLYFRSKEELFLALLSEELAKWLKALRDELNRMLDENQPVDELITAFTAGVAASLQDQKGLMRLIPLVQAILEQNIPAATALSFKRRLRMRFMAAGLQVETVLPFLRQGQGAELLLMIYMLLIGLQGMADPAPAVAQALQEPELGLFRVDLLPTLSIFLTRYLTGMAGLR